MELIKQNLNINFAGKFKLLGMVSATIVLISLICFLVIGLNYGVDFAGGTEIQLKVENTEISELRKVLKGFGKVEIQQFEGKLNEFLVRLPNISIADEKDVKSFIADSEKEFKGVKLLKKHYDTEVGDRVELWFSESIDQNKLKELYAKHNIPATGVVEYKRVGDRHIYKVMLQGLTTKIVETVRKDAGKKVELQRVELVGPKVGKKLRVDAFLSVLYALLAILVYIAFRFNYQFAPGAVAALVHDVMITLGIWSVFGLSFDLTIVAALLTIVGYSLNDTIVVYDRIRENWNDQKKGKTIVDKINTSLNETLSRTLLTSVTTLIVLLALLFLGGGIIRGFALAMTIGVVVGTYSSIFVASPVTVFIDRYVKKKSVV